jgi:hypothetical protein
MEKGRERERERERVEVIIKEADGLIESLVGLMAGIHGAVVRVSLMPISNTYLQHLSLTPIPNAYP